MIIFLLLCFSFGNYSFSAPKGKKTGVTFDRALPEDVSNENFPDRIDSFDFPNASLLDLVKAIGKLTGINFIVDAELQGKKISIIAPSSITVAEAYKAFLSALAVNGYTVIKSGAFWKIQSTQKAHKDNTEVYSGDYFPITDQLITRIIKLKYINAKSFETSIKWLLSQDNKISTHESSNSIILSDYGSVIERIMKIVYEMDIPGSEEGIQIIQIEHASADELSVILKELLSIDARSSRSSYVSRSNRTSPRVSLSPMAKKRSSAGSVKISSIIPDLRTNSLVVSANKEGLKKIYELIKKLDTPIDASQMGGVYVYNVLYGTAEEVYNTLMGIKPSDTKNNSRQQRSFFPPRRRSGIGSSSSPKSSQSPLFENVTIMADTNTNSLIISAKNKYEYERVLAVLKKIDVPRDQVFIQAIIIEMIISNGNSKDINLAGALSGILNSSLENKPWAKKYKFNEIFGSSFVGFLNSSFDVASLQKAQLGPGLILGLPFIKFLEVVNGPNSTPFSSIGADGVFNTPQFNTPQFNNLTEAAKTEVFRSAVQSHLNNPVRQALENSYFPLIRLLKTTANVNVLSTPQLTTLDNVSAFIEVGENAPIGLTSTATAGINSQNSVDRADITLRLDITPRINPESRTVQMDIKQKFDDFSNRSSTASELASRGVHIVKRNIETKMVLHDGETAVLGGLLRDKETTTENKVPLFGDIPVLGWLFKGKDVIKEKTNLLVFITPTIIKGEEQRAKTKQILGKKLEERIHFIKKYMKGQDHHGEALEQLIPLSGKISDKEKNRQGKPQKKKRKWFWQKESSFEKPMLKQENQEFPLSEPLEEELKIEVDDEERELFDPDFSDQDSSNNFLDEDSEPFSDSADEDEEFRPEDYQLAVPKDEALESESKSFVKEDEISDMDSGGEEILDNTEEKFIPIPPEDLNF